MKKFLCLLLGLCLLTGCTENNNEIVESKDPFVVQIFFSQTCGHCKKLKTDFVDRLKEDFGSQVSFEEYDIDLIESIDLYDTYIGLYDEYDEEWDMEGSLEGVDEELAAYNRYVPFCVIGDMYAFMGYDEELLDEYVQDVHLALQSRSLATGDVSIGRWEFKDEE